MDGVDIPKVAPLYEIKRKKKKIELFVGFNHVFIYLVFIKQLHTPVMIELRLICE